MHLMTLGHTLASKRGPTKWQSFTRIRPHARVSVARLFSFDRRVARKQAKDALGYPRLLSRFRPWDLSHLFSQRSFTSFR